MANIITSFGAIAVIKVINIIAGWIMHRQFIAEHTVINKITGMILFMLPLTLPFIDLNDSGIVVCVIATFAALQEGYLIGTKSIR